MDTNFLCLPAKFRLDVFSELEKFGRPELYTLDVIVRELEKIVKAGGRDAVSAKVGLETVKKKKIKILKSRGEKADDELVRLAGEGYIVCTQDAGLMDRLRAQGHQAITMRQKRYLVRV